MQSSDIAPTILTPISGISALTQLHAGAAAAVLQDLRQIKI